MIDSFSGEYAFLSNFYGSPLLVPRLGLVPTLEHAYQGMKSTNAAEQVWVAAASTPVEAKRRGRRVPLREDWDAIRIPIMRDLLSLKFFFDTKLAIQLLATTDNQLVEGNYWGDTFWGVRKGQGLNKLGRLLMSRRSDLRGDQSLTRY